MAKKKEIKKVVAPAASVAPNIGAIPPAVEPTVVKASAKAEYITDNPIEAEKIQKATGIIPLVKGNRLEGTREYKFIGLTSEKAKEIK